MSSIQILVAQNLNEKPSIERCAFVAAEVRASKGSSSTVTEARSLGIAALRAHFYEGVDTLFAAILEFYPDDPEALYYRALALFNLQRSPEAEPITRAAVLAAKSARQSSDALVLLGVIFAVQGRDQEAVQSLNQAVKLSPSSFDAQFALGRALYGAGEMTGAVDAFRRASELQPRDVKARFFFASALERAGDTTRALAAYRDLIEMAPDSAEGHLGLGVLVARLDGSSVQEAIAELSRATELDPTQYEARITLGRLLIRSGQPAAAIEHLRRAADIKTHNPEPHYQLALAFRQLGRQDDAGREFAIVESLNERHRQPVASSRESSRTDHTPQDPEPLYRLGLTLSAQEQGEAAISIWQQALKLRPEYSEVRLAMAEELFKLHRYQRAAELYEQAIRENPNEVVYYLRFGAAYFRQGRYAEARDAFEQAVERFPKSLESVYLLGYSERALGHYDAARVAFLRAQTLQGDNADVSANLGFLAAERGENSDAERLLRRAIELDEANFPAHYDLGRLLVRLRRYDEALAVLARGALLNPSDPGVHYQSFLALTRLKRDTEAQRELAAFSQLEEARKRRAGVSSNAAAGDQHPVLLPELPSITAGPPPSSVKKPEDK